MCPLDTKVIAFGQKRCALNKMPLPNRPQCGSAAPKPPPQGRANLPELLNPMTRYFATGGAEVEMVKRSKLVGRVEHPASNPNGVVAENSCWPNLRAP